MTIRSRMNMDETVRDVLVLWLVVLICVAGLLIGQICESL